MFFKWFTGNKKDESNSKSNKPEIKVVQDKVEEKHRESHLFKTKQVHVFYGFCESAVPSGCKHFLGYLCTRPEKSSVIPKECTDCTEILECLTNQCARVVKINESTMKNPNQV